MLNLRSIDLNLLPVFEAAYEERSLSRAAERLAMTQPAVSHALTRLRALCNDDLFTRRSRGVEPTPVADRVYASVRGALGAVREAVSERRTFDPLRSSRKFFISIPHPMGPLIAIRLRERLADIAPGVELHFSTRSRPMDLERDMHEGRVDLAVDWVIPTGARFRSAALFVDALVAVARSGHPALRRVRSVRDLHQGAFVTLRPRKEPGERAPGIEQWTGLRLPFVLEVSELLEVFLVASRSDLFGLVPRSMMKIARDVFKLRPLQAGPAGAGVPIKVVWPASRDRDPAHAFLRTQIEAATREAIQPINR
jgi:DNA-binding transcriptional LysR family regulator